MLTNKLYKFIFLNLTCIALVACWSTPPETAKSIGDVKDVERGFKLVNGLASCGFCHGEKSVPFSSLKGGQLLHDKYGEVTAPNLTPSDDALKDWSITEISNAVRFSVGPDEQYFSKEFHDGYDWMSDDDLTSIVTYLRTLPAINNDVEKRSLSFTDRNVTGFFDSWKVVENYVPSIPKTDQRAYGRYLVNHVANCANCHSSPETLTSAELYLAGGKLIKKGNSEKYAPGILNSEVDGVGTWNENEIVSYLQSGQKPDGQVVDKDFCPIEFYAYADLDDLKAIAKYLKSMH